MDARRIDTHAHIVPDFYRKWLADKGVQAGGRSIPEWSAEAHLDFMQANGIETSLLAVSTPGVEPAEGDAARQMARQLNEYSAQVVADHPGRFGFYATLTLPDVEGAVAEAAYALDILHADGIVLHAHSKGIYLGDPKFDPLMEELNRRKAVIFVHPSELPGGTVPEIPAYFADFLLDSVRAAFNLIRSGTMEHCPDLKILLSHGGGFLPYAASRLAGLIGSEVSYDEGIKQLQRFYLDTALASSKYSLPSLLAFAAPAHITYGTDFPYGYASLGAFYTSELDAFLGIDHHAVNRGSAELVFPRLAAAAP